MAPGILFFLLGLVVGSFLNVCIDRLPTGRSIVTASSHCETCGHSLGALDLLPLLSYLLLLGKCRYCKAPIPRRLPLVELATGLLFTLAWFHFDAPLELASALFFISLFIVISIIDLEHQLILNRLVYPALLAALVLSPLTLGHQVPYVLLGGAVGAALPLLIALTFPQGMGFGDVKYAALIGLVVAFPQIVATLTISFILGGLTAATLLLSGRKKWKEYLPFGPFLTLGAIVTMFYGQELIQWYVH